jgi:hypothetical protein
MVVLRYPFLRTSRASLGKINKTVWQKCEPPRSPPASSSCHDRCGVKGTATAVQQAICQNRATVDTTGKVVASTHAASAVLGAQRTNANHIPSNGLLLRQDVHILFDRVYLTVSPDYHVEVSRRLKDEFDNGKEYYSIQGRNITLPESPVFRPSEEQLTWHNETVYRP